MHEKEEQLVFKIGKRYGLKKRQIQELIDSDEKYTVVVPDNHNDKMNLLYDLILMVYADDVIDEHEVQFCEEVVERFGMKRDLVHWLLSEFDRGTPPPPDEWEEIKEEARTKFVLGEPERDTPRSACPVHLSPIGIVKASLHALFV